MTAILEINRLEFDDKDSMLSFHRWMLLACLHERVDRGRSWSSFLWSFLLKIILCGKFQARTLGWGCYNICLNFSLGSQSWNFPQQLHQDLLLVECRTHNSLISICWVEFIETVISAIRSWYSLKQSHRDEHGHL